MENKTRSTKALITTVIVFAGIFFGSYGQYQLAAIPSQVYSCYGLNDVQFSSAMTAPMVPAIFFSIVIGILADRFGIKMLATVCTFLGALGYILRSSFDSYSMLYLGMFLVGFMATVFNTNISKIISSLYPQEKVPKVIGILMAGSTAAMALAYGTTSWFPNLKSAFAVAMMAAIIVFVAWTALVRQKDFASAVPEEAEKDSLLEALKVSLKSKNVWFMGFALMTLLGGAMVISNFQVLYLVSKGYSEGLAGSFGTVLMIGAILGSILIPSYLQKVKKPAIALLCISLGAAVATVGMAFLPVTGLYVVSFMNGFLRSGVISMSMSFPVLFSDIGPRYAGTASGIACTLQLLGAVIIPTYIVIPLAGGNMAAYFYIAALFFVASAIFTYVISKNIKFH